MKGGAVHYPLIWKTSDGTALMFRSIRPEDAGIEQDFVRRLSHDSRFFRFLGEIRELSPELLRRLVSPDPVNEFALIATHGAGELEKEIAVGRFAHQPDGKTCEFAIAVADEWQGRGIGRRLMEELMTVARARGLETMRGQVLGANTRMLDFCRSLGFAVHISPEDTTTRVVERKLLERDC